MAAPVGIWRLTATCVGGQRREVGGLLIDLREDGSYAIRPLGREPPAPIEGHYQVRGSRMRRWVGTDLRLTDFEFTVTGDELRLRFPEGGTYVFERVARVEG